METQLTVAGQENKFTPEQIDLLKRTICKDSSNDEFGLFMTQCKRTGLDPFSKQIHAVFRFDSNANRKIMSIQVGIDGFRLVAQRSGDYEGQTPVQWCDETGEWKDIWLSREKNPTAARVGVYRKGFRDALYAVALWSEYAQQYKKNGAWVLSPMWQQMPALMLAKCAEALALRKAYPAELSGLYSPEEMSQADKVHEPKPLSAAQERPGFATGIPVEVLDKQIEEREKEALKGQQDLGTFSAYVKDARLGPNGKHRDGTPWQVYFITTESDIELATYEKKVFEDCKLAMDRAQKVMFDTEPGKNGPKIVAAHIEEIPDAVPA